MHRLFTLPLLVCALACACANQPADRSSGRAPESPASTDDAARAEAETLARSRTAIALAPRLHDATMTEVVLDAGGRAALTLDADGGVRLWPTLGDDVRAPVALPVHEPMWMSLGRSEHGFVAGFIDTAGGAQIGRIAITESGAHWIPAFEIPATEPLLELHVLDGGKRILALGVDHRIDLFDIDGAIVSRLDEPSFVPWQLRVAQPPAGDPSVVAVLVDPVRVQPIALTDERLAVTGSAHTVAIDRGPNRNDLVLAPDGKTVIAMQHQSKAMRVELELIDVRTGTRRILAAQTDMRTRPRLHPAKGEVLLESGSGKGSWIDLGAATPWPPPAAPADRTAIAIVSGTAVDLPASTAETRLHAVVVAGRRVVPTRDGLVIDPLSDGPARTLARHPLGATAVALDATGDRVAWGSKDRIAIESLSDATPPHTLSASDEGVALIAFVGTDHVATISPSGKAALRRIADGQEIDTAAVSVVWGIASAAVRAQEGDAVQLVVTSLKPSEPLRVLPVTAQGFGAPREVARADRSAWPEAGKPRNMNSGEWVASIGLSLPALRLRPAAVELTEPDPSGRRIAITQKAEHRERFDGAEDRMVIGPHDHVVTIVDREPQQKAWSFAARGLSDIGWSGDGERLAIVDETGGWILDAHTGVTIHERRDLGLQTR